MTRLNISKILKKNHLPKNFKIQVAVEDLPQTSQTILVSTVTLDEDDKTDDEDVTSAAGEVVQAAVNEVAQKGKGKKRKADNADLLSESGLDENEVRLSIWRDDFCQDY